MCKHFANKLYSINTYFYFPVWIMMVYNNFDAQNLLFICLQISPQIFAILQNFAMDKLRDQQFCTLLCELESPVVVLFTGLALEVEVQPGMVWYNMKNEHWWALTMEENVNFDRAFHIAGKCLNIQLFRILVLPEMFLSKRKESWP